jgi:hypothetical protein
MFEPVRCVHEDGAGRFGIVGARAPARDRGRSRLLDHLDLILCKCRSRSFSLFAPTIPFRASAPPQ